MGVDSEDVAGRRTVGRPRDTVVVDDVANVDVGLGLLDVEVVVGTGRWIADG